MESSRTQRDLIIEINTDVKWIKNKISNHCERISMLEEFKNRVNGAMTIIGVVVTLIIAYLAGIYKLLK